MFVALQIQSEAKTQRNAEGVSLSYLAFSIPFHNIYYQVASGHHAYI
jgi:hypothetical protein